MLSLVTPPEPFWPPSSWTNINHCLTIWHQLFREFWLVDTWFFAHPRDQGAVTRLENVCQLNIRRDKKLGFQSSHRQPLMSGTWNGKESRRSHLAFNLNVPFLYYGGHKTNRIIKFLYWKSNFHSFYVKDVKKSVPYYQ